MCEYQFLKDAGRALNSGQSRALIFSGNTSDLFGGKDGNYIPLIGFLADCWRVPGKIVISYEVNGPVRFYEDADRDALREAWVRWRTGTDGEELAIRNLLTGGRAEKETERRRQEFEEHLRESVGKPALAFEFLRQLCLCARSLLNGQRTLGQELLILIEAADMLLPEGEIARLSDSDRQRICICHDWFSDPGFLNSSDAVVLLCESRSLLNSRIARLPQLYEVPVPLPDHAQRLAFVAAYQAGLPEEKQVRFWAAAEEFATFSAGMTLHALLQLLKGARHSGAVIGIADLIAHVETYVCAQLGEGVVEFKRPTHTLEQVIGFTRLKEFLRREFIPRCRGGEQSAFAGAGVCGPIGGGKSYIFEAVASELGIIVLVLKNIRSQWFGQTDVIFERLYRLLQTLPKVLIFVDEADTQFGAIGADAHPTERRLTGKIQAMMADPALKGRVIWLLMTARINLLSPDLRRPGRVGDLIIPVLDPQGADRQAFVRWVLEKGFDRAPTQDELQELSPLFAGTSAAGFSSLRSEMAAGRIMNGRSLEAAEIRAIIEDRLEPDIALMRRYQELQALLNCTRRSLLPDPQSVEQQRERWQAELQQLQLRGYS